MNLILLNISDLNSNNAIIGVVGLTIVFLALTVLYVFFRTVPLIIEWQKRLSLRKKGVAPEIVNKKVEISTEINAAIGVALYLYLSEIHDEENTVMTIKKVSKTYSPWSSKLYSMRWPIR